MLWPSITPNLGFLGLSIPELCCGTGQTDRQTDGQTDRQTPPPILQCLLPYGSGGIIIILLHKAPFTLSVSTRVDASNQTNVKDRKHSHRPTSTNSHTSNKRCQFKLYIGYSTSNNNKWPKCSCRYQTPPDNSCANDLIDDDVTENDVIYICNAYITCKQAKCGRVDARRRDALGVNGA